MENLGHAEDFAPGLDWFVDDSYDFDAHLIHLKGKDGRELIFTRVESYVRKSYSLFFHGSLIRSRSSIRIHEYVASRKGQELRERTNFIQS